MRRQRVVSEVGPGSRPYRPASGGQAEDEPKCYSEVSMPGECMMPAVGPR
jgi:hypothetical protein